MTAELDECWCRFLEGSPLAADEASRLHEALIADQALRLVRLQDCQLDGVLRGLAACRESGDAFVSELFGRVAAEGSSEPFVQGMDARVRTALRPPRRRIRGTVMGLSLGAALLAVVGGAALRRGAGQGHVVTTAVPSTELTVAASEGTTPAPALPLATVSEVRGQAWTVVGGRKRVAEVGQVVALGAGIFTVGPDSGARLALADGTRFDLGGDTHVASIGVAGGTRVFLSTGMLRAQVAPQPAGEPLIVSSPHADAVVVGTRFAVQVSTTQTRLVVEEGRVRLRRTIGGGGEALLAAGQAGVASERVTPVASIAAPGGSAVFVVGSMNLGPGDEAARRRLAELGFEVKVRAPGLLLDSELRGSALVVLSSTIPSVDMTTPFRELPVPVLCWENMLFAQLGMVAVGSDMEHGMLYRDGEELVVKDPLHPLAAGLAGPQRLTTRRTDFTWGVPGPLATWVATVPGKPTRAGVFAYERGAPLAGGGEAPARRTGLFLYDMTATVLTPAGWALFDAAVKWTAERRAEP